MESPILVEGPSPVFCDGKVRARLLCSQTEEAQLLQQRCEMYLRTPSGVRFWSIPHASFDDIGELYETLPGDACESARPFALIPALDAPQIEQRFDVSLEACVWTLFADFCACHQRDPQAIVQSAALPGPLQGFPAARLDALWQGLVLPDCWDEPTRAALARALEHCGAGALTARFEEIAQFDGQNRRGLSRGDHDPQAPWEYRGLHRFRLRSQRLSSQYFGSCQVCKQHASEVFIQACEQWFELLHGGRWYGGWSIKPCGFGHEHCLRALRVHYH